MEQKEIPLSGDNLKDQLSKLPDDQVQQIVNQSNHWADYQKYTGMMHGIARNMKEIPEIPSETPKDSNALTKVEFPETGGVLTYMEGFDYPYQGYPHFEFVDKIDSIKKTSRAFISGIYHQLKTKNRLWFITLLPGMWFSKDLLRSWIYVNYRLIDRFKIKELRYCQFVRELHRAFSVEIPGESRQDYEFRLELRDLSCMILEMDNAYRFRAQDILGEINQESLKRNATGEFMRLLDLIQSRETHQEVKDTWTLLKYIVKFYLKFDKKLSNILISTFSNLNLEKVRLINNDKVFCIPRKDYVFGFQLNPSQEDIKLIKKNELLEGYKEEKGKIKQQSTEAHKAGGNLQELDKKYEQLLNDAEMRYKTDVMGLL